MHPRAFSTRDLLDPQGRLGRPDVHHGLDLESSAVEVEIRQMFRPEGVVAVTEVGVAGAEGQIHQPAENPVPETPADRDVVAPAAVREAGPLGKVGSGHQGGHEANDLGPRGGTVAVHHHDDVAGTGLEPGEEGVALALPRLCDDFDVGSALPGDGDGLVHGVTVHQDHFVDPIGKRAQHHWQVPRLVLDRDHHADRRHDRQLLREGPVSSEQALVGRPGQRFSRHRTSVRCRRLCPTRRRAPGARRKCPSHCRLTLLSTYPLSDHGGAAR